MISQCMIVKNEEANIVRALSWGKGIVGEQIVVDTGSTDRTAALAKEMGAAVYEIVWEDDFSKAKNYALEQATGDWIAFLDADEYLAPAQTAADLAKVLETLPRAYHVVSTAWICLDDNGAPFSNGRQERFFRNIKGLRYREPIHEYLSFTDGSAPVLYDASSQFAIMHTGYSASELERTDKIERNIRLLRKELERQPRDTNIKSYLAAALLQHQETEEGRRLLWDVIADHRDMDPTLLHQAYFNLLKSYCDENKKELLGKIEEVHHLAVSWNHAHPDYDYLLGAWYARGQAWKPARECYERACGKCASYQGTLPQEMAAHMLNVYYTLMQICGKLSDVPGSMQYAVMALQTDRFQPEILCTLLHILKAEEQTPAVVSQVMNLLGGLYNFAELKDKAMVYQCAKVCNYEELFQCMDRMLSEEEKRMIDASS